MLNLDIYVDTKIITSIYIRYCDEITNPILTIPILRGKLNNGKNCDLKFIKIIHALL